MPWLTNQRWFRKHAAAEMAKIGRTHGFSPPWTHFTAEDLQRCLVSQDMGIFLNRLADGIDWVNNRLGVYPLWICPIAVNHRVLSRPGKVELRTPDTIVDDCIVDIGVYGEPTVTPFRHRRVLKELADFVDFPSTWGVSYTSTGEIRAKHDAVRAALGAIGVFPGREDKVTFRKQEDGDLDEEPLVLWRLRREYGPYWPVKLGAVVALVMSAIVWAVRILVW